MILGNNVRVFRLARGEGLREMAGQIGIDPGNLSRIERGERGCADELKMRIANHFGVPVTRLFFQENVVFKTTSATEAAS